MDLAGAKAGDCVPLVRARWRPAHVRLTIAALCTFASAGCVLALGGMFAERTLPDATFAPFGGWQLYAMGAGFGLILLALLVISVAGLQRRIRAHKPRLAHQRAVVLGAFLPGLLAGALLGNPMSSAIAWASNQTASAADAKAEAGRLQAESRAGPPAPATGKPAAPSSISAHLLRPMDLGSGWYEGQQPAASQTAVTATEGMFGATLAVKATVQRAYWTGSAWLPRQLLVERMTRFRTAGGARRYLSSASHRTGEFLVGTDVFSVSINVAASGDPTPAEFGALVAKAVQRAR